MTDRVDYTMTQADLDKIMGSLNAERQVSGMFLSGGQPMGNVQEAADRAWAELGNRMGFDGMTARPRGDNPLHFTAIPNKEATT